MLPVYSEQGAIIWHVLADFSPGMMEVQVYHLTNLTTGEFTKGKLYDIVFVCFSLFLLIKKHQSTKKNNQTTNHFHYEIFTGHTYCIW